MTADIVPREWEPAEQSAVLDTRRSNQGTPGRVIRVDRYGHFADPYWRADIRWAGGRVETGVETSHLTREDGTQ